MFNDHSRTREKNVPFQLLVSASKRSTVSTRQNEINGEVAREKRILYEEKPCHNKLPLGLVGCSCLETYKTNGRLFLTYDHRTLKTRLPVRSALFKQRTGGLVVRWVTTSEYLLLYVFGFFSIVRANVGIGV